MSEPRKIQIHALREGTLVVLDRRADYNEVLTDLERALTGGSAGFPGAGLIVDVGSRELETRQLLQLEELISRHLGSRVLQIVNDEADEILRDEEPRARGSANGTGSSTATARADTAIHRLAVADRAQLLRRTVRSGQRITYDGSIVVLGDVNAGAEVIASGDIVIMGALRGVAHAGARGSTGMCVTALKMMPVQLRIAHLIGRPPEDAGRVDEPELAFVRDGRIVVEALAARAEAPIWQGGNGLWVERS